jgi:hypothetical protein
MKLGVAEILEQASKMKKDQERIAWLQHHNSVALETVLRGAFDSTIVWQLPEGDPPYKPNDLVDQQNQLYTECRKMYLFIEGGSPNLKQTKRETLFIEILETVDPKDAKLLLSIKNKKLPYKNITPELVNKAFPGILSNNV